ncbi:fumarate hydratase FumD, partial [Escherichia coli]
MGNRTKEDELYREMCRVVGKVVLEMRDLGQEPKHIVIAGVLRTALANKRIQRSELEKHDQRLHLLFALQRAG